MNMRKNIAVLVAMVCLLFSLVARSAEQGFSGTWLLTLDDVFFENGEIVFETEKTGYLTLEETDAGIKGYVDGGSVDVSIEGKAISIALDWIDLSDTVRMAQLKGKLGSDGVIKGTFLPKAGDKDSLNWQAHQVVEDAGKPKLKAKPVDFTGMWTFNSEGLAKATYLVTPAAKKIIADYDHMDDNVSRCTSPGLVRMAAWPYLMEMVSKDDQLTIIYEGLHEVRRVYLDGRSFPEDGDDTAMGYSIGHWEGSTLVVETRQLRGLYMNSVGAPVSENAYVVERMSLTDDGQTFKSDMVIHDPEFYEKPLTFNRMFGLSDRDMPEYDCDPHSFYRDMSLDGTLEEYWSRAKYRR